MKAVFVPCIIHALEYFPLKGDFTGFTQCEDSSWLPKNYEKKRSFFYLSDVTLDHALPLIFLARYIIPVYLDFPVRRILYNESFGTIVRTSLKPH